VVLEFASTQPPAVAREFLAEMAHMLGALFSALQAKAAPTPACSPPCSRPPAKSPGRGHRARARLDEAWAEPEAFDGCATRGQNRPGQPQPVHFVRKAFRLFFPRSLAMSAWIDHFLFGLYPTSAWPCSSSAAWVRFDRDQYTWKSDSSQLLRTGSLRWASNLFHIGVLFLFFGHFVGMLTPHAVYEPFISAGHKQVLAMVSGGIAGLLGFIGVTLLLHRRLSDARIRATSKTSDIALLWIFWVQLALGLATIPLSGQHLDGSVMMVWPSGASASSPSAPTPRCWPASPGLQGPPVPGHDDVPDLPVHPPGACGAASARWPTSCAPTSWCAPAA
jgi:respiratory nitrate reductase gamma subunit